MSEHSQYVIEWQKKNPEKLKAHQMVKRALETGKLIRGVCEVCGNEKVDGHHDDYSKPLDVRWLCKKHHGEVHRGQRKKYTKEKPKKITKNKIIVPPQELEALAAQAIKEKPYAFTSLAQKPLVELLTTAYQLGRALSPAELAARKRNAQKAGRPVGSKDKHTRHRRKKAEMEAARQTETQEK